MVRSHASGQNFLMVIVRFLETFAGSLSAGQSSFYCSIFITVIFFFKFTNMHKKLFFYAGVGVGFISALISF